MVVGNSNIFHNNLRIFQMARNGKSNQNKKNKQKTTPTVEVKPVETVKTVETKKPVPIATEEPSK